MKLSIIIPVYNSEKLITRCIRSIIEQNYKNYEILLVEDHSTDDSLKICQELSLKYPEIVLLQTSGKGVSAARNTGLAHASGDIIGFCDADDYFEPNALRQVMKLFASQRNLDLIVTGFYEVSSDLHSQRAFCLKKERYCNFAELMPFVLNEPCVLGSVWNKFFRRELTTDIRFDVNLSYCEDTHFVMNVLSKNPHASCLILNQAFYHYVMNENSTTHDCGQLFDKDGQLKYINAIYAVIRDCDLSPKLRSEAGYAIVCLSIDTIVRFHPQGVNRKSLRKEIRKHGFDYCRNILKYNKKANIKRLMILIREELKCILFVMY